MFPLAGMFNTDTSSIFQSPTNSNTVIFFRQGVEGEFQKKKLDTLFTGVKEMKQIVCPSGTSHLNLLPGHRVDSVDIRSMVPVR